MEPGAVEVTANFPLLFMHRKYFSGKIVVTLVGLKMIEKANSFLPDSSVFFFPQKKQTYLIIWKIEIARM